MEWKGINTPIRWRGKRERNKLKDRNNPLIEKKKGTEKGFFGGGEGAFWPTFNLSKSGRSPKPMGRDGWRHKCLTS